MLPLAAQAFDGKLLDCGVVDLVRHGLRLGIFPGFNQLLEEHRANSMNGLMSIQAFRHQPIDRPTDRQLIADRDLVFNTHMEGGMQPFAR